MGFEEMVMSPIHSCPVKVPTIPGLSKNVNLIDLDECDVPVDISPRQRWLPPSTLEKNPEVFMNTSVMRKEAVTIPLEEGHCGLFSLEQTSSRTTPCHRIGVEELLPTCQEPSDTMNSIDCSQADAKSSTPRNEEDLEKENQILLQRLADAEELKKIELSFVRDEVECKQRMIDELLIKSREVEAQLSKWRIMGFQAGELAGQAKALENLRSQLDERETLLDYRETEIQQCDDAWLAFSGSSAGGGEKRHCFCFKPTRIRGCVSSIFRLFSRRRRQLETY